MRASSVVLLSGGLDSLACFYWAQKQTDIVLGLTFDYGQKAAVAEIKAAQKICQRFDIKHKVIDLTWVKDLTGSALISQSKPLPKVAFDDLDNPQVTQHSAKLVWVPNRNGLLINCAAAIAEDQLASQIFVGFNKEEAQTFSDNSKAFVKSVNQALELSTQEEVTLCAPFIENTKTEILAWLLENQIDLSVLWSCYLTGDRMCGACESCTRLKRALIQNQANQWLETLF